MISVQDPAAKNRFFIDVPTFRSSMYIFLNLVVLDQGKTD